METKKLILLASLTMSTALLNSGCGQQVQGTYQVQVTAALPGMSPMMETGNLSLIANNNAVTGTLTSTGTYGTTTINITGTENGNAGQVTGQGTMISSSMGIGGIGVGLGSVAGYGYGYGGYGTSSGCGPLTVNLTVTGSNGEHMVNGTATGSSLSGVGSCSFTFNGTRPN